jgi:hypothetical protein
MNLITRTIPVLLLGLSGLGLSGASQADSSFSLFFSSGYAAPYVSYAYHDSYRPYPRHYRPPVHVDTYVEKHVYRNYGTHGRNYRDYDNRHGYDGRRNEHRKYRGRNDRHSRGHSDRNVRRHQTNYASTLHY